MGLDGEQLIKLLEQVRSGETGVAEAVAELKHLPFRDIGSAKIDHHRQLRSGVPEVVYCAGKTTAQAAQAFRELAAHSDRVLATRVPPRTARSIQEEFPAARYSRESRLLYLSTVEIRPRWGAIAILTAGTADIPVAEEAALTAELLENRVLRLYDVGVAGIHRLLEHLPELDEAQVVIAIAGMDGVLPSVVAGLVDKPVIAVPTSTGYGANFRGLAPLLTMLNSCSPGIGVVNIDNGFGAAALAHLITRSGGGKLS
jgi:NCAIR mutase (PurE)-related protein